ncbi:MAG TPA: hypothetical protein VGQ19_19880, partial [Burkholderiales bacterium]|nr:hypothetical protein [Burkholderiales bacterium]
STEQCIQALWESHQRGDFFSQAWRGKLELHEAYRGQLGLLDRKVERGERQAGWKVGLTADVMREMFGGRSRCSAICWSPATSDPVIPSASQSYAHP